MYFFLGWKDRILKKKTQVSLSACLFPIPHGEEKQRNTKAVCKGICVLIIHPQVEESS